MAAMFYLMWFCFLFIQPLAKSQEFTTNHNSRISCLKASHVLHINLGNSDSSQNFTPVQQCRESSEQAKG